jgi:uncharacterized protein (DUF2235 family)
LYCAFDGTWNKAEHGAVTNVFRLAQLLPRTPTQLVWYDEGVGTGTFQKLRGAFGFGLSRNIQQGYAYLALTYEPGDEIFLFGFSRGAYTARSLAGLIRKCGILRRSQLPVVRVHDLSDRDVQARLDDVIAQIEQSYELYRQRDGTPDTPASLGFRQAHAHALFHPTEQSDPTATRIKFRGVWDTVGSLGVPLKTRRGVSAWNKDRYLFHDSEPRMTTTHSIWPYC